MAKRSRIDKPLAFLIVLLVVAGCLIFASAGFAQGGGLRWIKIANFSLQPSESLKIGSIIFAAAYFSAIRTRVSTLRYGLSGFLVILALPALLLILQPDLGTLGIVALGVFATFIAAGARIRDIAVAICIGLIALGALAFMRPYVFDRVVTFFHPSQNAQAEGYQIRQSLIAIGSGGLLGRGFGQGIQKFTYLPEPMGDSIFAVAAEELGFVGSISLIGLFLALALRGFHIAARAPDLFGALLATGISTTLVAQAFINIGAMLSILPLTGIPLTFVSQGGSAMMISLASVGILLNVSKFRAKSGKLTE